MGFKKKRFYDLFQTEKLLIKPEGTLVGDLSDIPKKYRAPTIMFESKDKNMWILQVKVNTSDAYSALEILEKKCPKWCDSHDGNCGWYKGKPVVFDWWFKELNMKLYVVRNKQGKYFRAIGYGGYGSNWVDTL